MADYPYTTVPGKISKLFERIKETGVPEKATQKWLKSIRFTSSNDRSLLRILAFVGMRMLLVCPQTAGSSFAADEGSKYWRNASEALHQSVWVAVLT